MEIIPRDLEVMGNPTMATAVDARTTGVSGQKQHGDPILLVSPESSTSSSSFWKERRHLALQVEELLRQQHQQPFLESNIDLERMEHDDVDDDFSVELDSGDADKRRKRPEKLKHKLQQQQQLRYQRMDSDEGGAVGNTLEAYKLEEWMTSSEEDECSDMISEDYSRQHQRESSLLDNNNNQEQPEEDERIVNMSIVFGQQQEQQQQSSDFSVEDGDYDDLSSLSSYNTFFGRESDIQSSGGDAKLPYRSTDTDLLAASYRTVGSGLDPMFFFSPSATSPTEHAVVSPEIELNMLHTPQGVSQLAFGDEDESENDGDVEDITQSMHQMSPTKRKSPKRASTAAFRSPPKISPLSEKGKSKSGRVAPAFILELESMPDDVMFSPESQRTFLPKRFQNGSDKNTKEIPLHVSRIDLLEHLSLGNELKRSSDVTVASSASTLTPDLQYTSVERPAFVSDIEYTAPLIDKSELPTTKTRKSLNRKRSVNQQTTWTNSQEQNERNNRLLDNLLSSPKELGSAQRSLTDDESSKQKTMGNSRSRSASITYDQHTDDVSISRSFLVGGAARLCSDDSDDYSIVSEISADSIHRNVRVKRTTRTKKIKKGKTTSDNEPLPGSVGNADGITSSMSIIKKKKAAKKARPKKRGKKDDFQQCPGDSTHESRANHSLSRRKIEGKNRNIEERIDAIFNNKEQFFTELDQKMPVTPSSQKVESQNIGEKPKSLRIRSKVHGSTSVLERWPISRRNVGQPHHQCRSRSQSRSLNPTSESSGRAVERRSRSKSMDLLDGGRTSNAARMRGKKVTISTTDNPSKEGTIPSKTNPSNAQRTSRTSAGPKSSRSLISDAGSVHSFSSLMLPRQRRGVRGEENAPYHSTISRTASVPIDKKEKSSISPASFGSLRAKLNSAVFQRRDKVADDSGSSEKEKSGENIENPDASLHIKQSKKSLKNDTQCLKSDSKTIARGSKGRKDSPKGKDVKDLKSPAGKRNSFTAVCVQSPQLKTAVISVSGNQQRSPKRSSPRSTGVDRDIEEALQRHNFGPVLSTFVLGSPMTSSETTVQPKQDSKKNRRQWEKDQEGTADSISTTPLGKSISDGEICRSSILSDEASLLRSVVSGDKVDTKGGIEDIRQNVKRKKRQIKRQISEIRSQTEEDILKMEQDLTNEKRATRLKLLSLEDPAEALKHMLSAKAARLHDEGKSLKREMMRLENGVVEQVAISNDVIQNTLSIQAKTQELTTEVCREEQQNAQYVSMLDVLQKTHTSVSQLLDEQDVARYDEDGKSFVSNFVVPDLEKKPYTTLKKKLSRRKKYGRPRKDQQA